MKLAYRYVAREMVVPFLIGQAAIVLMLTGTVLYNNASVLLMHRVPWADVARMVLYFLPFLVHMTMPVAMAVGASLAVSRLGKDSEITVMRSAGMSLNRIFLPIFVTGLAISVGDFFFGEYAVPETMSRFNEVVASMPTHIPNLSPEAGHWFKAGNESYTFFVRTAIARKGYIEMHGIKLVTAPRNAAGQSADSHDLWADSGRYQDGNLTLYDPMDVSMKPDTRDVVGGQASQVTIPIYVDPQEIESTFALQLPMGTMASSSTKTFSELGSELARDRASGIRDPVSILDYHFKMSVPFSCLVMALCCPPVALRFARGGGFTGTLLSICLVFVYWNTLLLARIVGSPGPDGAAPLLAPAVAAWSQNVLFALFGLFMLKRSE